MISRVAMALLAMTFFVGCERAQTPEAGRRKADTAAWTSSDTAVPAYAAPGWKVGDKTAWEEQLRKRNQAQNDYQR